MGSIKDIFQSADWKTEKHVPVIEAPDLVKKSEAAKVTISVGKQISHPNTTEHHISWLEVYFLPDGEKFPQNLGRFELAAHGASTQGPNTSTIFTQPEVIFSFKTEKSGLIMATSFCNIHGLWENSKKISLG